MARRKSAPVELEAVDVKATNSGGFATYEVVDRLKSHKSFLLAGGVIIPITDGKVTVGETTHKLLSESGYLK